VQGIPASLDRTLAFNSVGQNSLKKFLSPFDLARILFENCAKTKLDYGIKNPIYLNID
jgi:hypothetical protein